MTRWLSILLLVALVVTAACGDDDDDDDTDDVGDAAATVADTAATTASGAATTVTGAVDGEGDAAAGQQVYQANCITCHTTDGAQGVGPTWQGLYGSEVPLEGGETVTADDEYIRESILDPNAKIHQGFAPAMPTFQGVLTDEQITNVIAYIKTLE
jgi:cytochrome c oxidase subunit 2